MPLVNKIITFLHEIGIEVTCEQIGQPTFLPGIRICNGALIIDLERLLYPGDILHEAGHLAVMPPDIRSTMNDDLDNNQIHQGGEMMAIAWSYAACIYLQIDPRIVFHEEGYKGGSAGIIENFSEGRYFGVPLLQWSGMTYDDKNAAELNMKPYPNMVSWLCLKNNYAEVD